MKQNVIINADLCIGCGACEQDCPQLEFRIVDGKATTVSERCIRCGHCLAICPKGAISMCNAYEESVPIDLREQVDPSVLHNVLYQRRTIRQFRQQDISTDIIADILDAGRVTHTGKNRQGLPFMFWKIKRMPLKKLALPGFGKLRLFAVPSPPIFGGNKFQMTFSSGVLHVPLSLWANMNRTGFSPLLIWNTWLKPMVLV